MPDDVRYSLLEHTSFLNYDAPINVRAYYIVNDLRAQKACATCGTFLISIKTNYCCSKCAANNPTTVALRSATVLDKYGVSNVSQSDTVKQQIKQTSLLRYGVDNPAQSTDARKKIQASAIATADSRMKKVKETCVKRYGVDNVNRLDCVKEKKKQTTQQRYSHDSYFQTPEFRKQKNTALMTKYGVDNISKLGSTIEKIKATKQQRYGNASYNNRSGAQHTMQQRYGAHHSQAHWSYNTRDCLSDPEKLSKFVQGLPLNYAATQLNIAPTTLRNTVYRHNIHSHLSRVNQYEQFVQEILDQAGIEYTRNDRTVLDGLELDFVIPSKNIAIEINGIYWHSELMGKHKHYHVWKTQQCKQQGLQLLHLWDYQFDKNAQLIKSMILNRLGIHNTRVYARSTQLVLLTREAHNKFLTENHLSGTINSSIRYGLEHKGKLVAAMSFGKSRFKANEIEMYRFAVLANHSVPGAAGKMFAGFLQQHNASKVISFADRDISQGGVYTALGFKQVAQIPPSYRYFKNRKIYNRLHFQKHKLKNILPYYDSALTEWQNMQLNGYNRFWNTGQLKYEYNTN